MGLQNSFTIPRLPVSAPVVLLALTPVVLPAAYAAYVLRQGARRTTASASISPPDPLPLPVVREKVKEERERVGGIAAEQDGEVGDEVMAIPPAVLAARELYVISRERVVSEAVPLERILPSLRGGLESQGREEGGRGLLEKYVSSTMRTFTWTPQAFIIKFMVSRLPNGKQHADTYSASYLEECCFEVGDRVCGVYTIRERIQQKNKRGEGERIILDLNPPEGWKGPVVTGALDCGLLIEEGEEGKRFVRLVNETVMWRRKEEKPTLLEGGFGRWAHTLMVGWLIVRGVEAVTRGDGKGKVEDKET
ncbi:hypothetical protein HD806DRAFT_493340 [Xylariaceae sp. AK1471]|nr:hypothetical protein HD806DRAFT_493340 [Xylariaceae sp. AK1471]